MEIVTRRLGLTDYSETLALMQAFTAKRTAQTADELWLTEHAPVYTLGLNRKNIRLPANNIPLVNVDRGGKITYHGLGQVVIYLLIDLNRRKLNVRQLVSLIENSMIDVLAQLNVKSFAKADAPGVYVQDNNQQKKIASLGLRLKNNCCYHGLSLNVNMDLAPFGDIDPCGYVGQQVTQTKDLGLAQNCAQMGELLIQTLLQNLKATLNT